MRDCKFKRLILGLHEKWSDPEYLYTKRIKGYDETYHHFSVTLFTEISTDAFSRISDIERYMNLLSPSVITISSDNQILTIKRHLFSDYRLEDDILYVKLKTMKEEIVFYLKPKEENKLYGFSM